MATQAPKSTDLFGDAVDAKDVAMRQIGRAHV